MLARIRKSMEQKDQGFTLIELLVVMIIIGILAAIAIPVFLNQRKKARETSAKADVSTIGKEVFAYYVDGTGSLTLSQSGTTWTLKSGNTDVTSQKLSGTNAATGTITDATHWCVQVDTHNDGDGIWAYTTEGLFQGNCSGAATGTANQKYVTPAA